ncbi:MAG: DUF1795 domain-containing protein [Blautia sp.]|nr:DUF1795 domain-containing protein [Blautia sp.]MCM1199756.1 DUF1795 domain-containing protein [Bacteroides fragilis]
MKRKTIGKVTACMLAFMLLAGCGAKPDTQETLAQGDAVTDEAQPEGASPENGAEGGTENEAGAEEKGSEDGNKTPEPLEIDEATKAELTTQLLLENELDTSVLEDDGTTDKCTFALPEDFTAVEDIPGMYVTKRYPIDASTIYYAEMDKDISMQLMTEETYVEQMESNFQNYYDMEVDVNLQSFEKIRISGHPAFRILCTYMVDGIEITQLAYVINADKSYVVTYSQTDEYYRMDEFEASAATIELELEN